MSSIFIATSDFLLNPIDQSVSVEDRDPTLMRPDTLTYRSIGFDPLLLTIVCASSFFTALSPRMPHHRVLPFDQLQLLSMSPTFCYTRELHLQLRIKGKSPLSHHLTKKVDPRLDFLRDLFVNLIQVQTVSFGYPHSSTTKFFELFSARRAGSVPTKCDVTSTVSTSVYTSSKVPVVVKKNTDEAKNEEKSSGATNDNDDNGGDDGGDNANDNDNTNTTPAAATTTKPASADDDEEEAPLNGHLNILQLLVFLPALENLAIAKLSRSVDFEYLLYKDVLPRRIRALDVSGTSAYYTFDTMQAVVSKFRFLRYFFMNNYYSKVTPASMATLITPIRKNLIHFECSVEMEMESIALLSECDRLQYLKATSIRNFDAVFARNMICRMVLQGCRFEVLQMHAAYMHDEDEDDKERVSTLKTQNQEDDKCFLDDFATRTDDDGKKIDPCPLLPILNRTATTLKNLKISDAHLILFEANAGAGNTYSSSSSNNNDDDSDDKKNTAAAKNDDDLYFFRQEIVTDTNGNTKFDNMNAASLINTSVGFTDSQLARFPTMALLTNLELHSSQVNARGAKFLGSILPSLTALSITSMNFDVNAFVEALSTVSKPPLQTLKFSVNNHSPSIKTLQDSASKSKNLIDSDLSFMRDTIQKLDFSLKAVLSSKSLASLTGAPLLTAALITIENGQTSECEGIPLSHLKSLTPKQLLDVSLFSSGGSSSMEPTLPTLENSRIHPIFPAMYHLSNFPSLTKLRLNTEHIDDTSLSLLVHQPLKDLTMLKLSKDGNNRFTNNGWKTLLAPTATFSQTLTTLFMRTLPAHITNLEGLRNCKNLTMLRLMVCPGISDDLGEELAHLPKLVIIMIRHCENFTKMGVIRLMEKADEVKNDFSNLRNFAVARCRDMKYPKRDPRLFPNEPMSATEETEQKAELAQQGEIIDRLDKKKDDDDDDFGTLIPDEDSVANPIFGGNAENAPKWKKKPFPADMIDLKELIPVWRSEVNGRFM